MKKIIETVQKIKTETICFHCGEKNDERTSVLFDDHFFCCHGCKQVYELLNKHNLCQYYTQQNHPGNKIGSLSGQRFDYLDDVAVQNELLSFRDSSISKITFYVPQIHCSSCIWLLENLYVINPDITESRVQFVRKELYISFKNTSSLKTVVEQLASLGYEPLINLNTPKTKENQKTDHSLIYKIGVTGFCAGNIMLFSFPEYFGDRFYEGSQFQKWFSYFNLILSLPVFFYGASNYFISAFQSLKYKTINMDVPIALGTGMVFFRSAYEVLSGTGVGYFDSLTGLVFFLLIGQWFQRKTYNKLSFENNYQSYFPLAVKRLNNKGKEETVLANYLQKDEIIAIHNQEIIPCDSILLSDFANIDYSFVSGESNLEKVSMNNLIYAGGRHIGTTIYLKVVKPVSASHLTQLWNKEVFQKEDKKSISKTLDIIGKRFTIVTLLVTAFTFVFWQIKNPSIAVWAPISVLLVACPCAIALAMPFGLSNAARWLSKLGFYVKNPNIIEKISKVNHLVFDKTGTLSVSNSNAIEFFGEPLTEEEEILLKSVVKHSLHPLSQSLSGFLYANAVTLDSYQEFAGKGMVASCQSKEIKIGSAPFLGLKSESGHVSKVYVMIDGVYKGYYTIQKKYRQNLLKAIHDLKSMYKIDLLSGDHATEKGFLNTWFDDKNMHFQNTPEDKLAFVENLKEQNEVVFMVGDGLNDAGALKAADVGMSVSDNVYYFSPACDVIAEADKLAYLPHVLKFSKRVMKGLWISFILSFLYNVVGFYFAFTGQLSPLVAAILMPTSSITVVLIAVFTVNFLGKKLVKETGH